MIPSVSRAQYDCIQLANHLVQKADKEHFLSWKVNDYCKAVKMFLKGGDLENAQKTLEKAREQRVSSGNIDLLCKLAKSDILIQSMRNPKTHSPYVPRELKQAKKEAQEACLWAKRQPHGCTTLGSTYSKDLSSIAKRYFQFSRLSPMPTDSKGESFLQQSREWAGYETRLFEKLQAYQKIAYILKKEGNIKELQEITNIMAKFIPSFSEKHMSLGFWSRLADIFLDVDLFKEAASCIAKAEEDRKEYCRTNTTVDTRMDESSKALVEKYQRLTKNPLWPSKEPSKLLISTTLKLLDYLDVHSLFKMGQVSFYLRKISSKDIVWKKFVENTNTVWPIKTIFLLRLPTICVPQQADCLIEIPKKYFERRQVLFLSTSSLENATPKTAENTIHKKMAVDNKTSESVSELSREIDFMLAREMNPGKILSTLTNAGEEKLHSMCVRRMVQHPLPDNVAQTIIARSENIEADCYTIEMALSNRHSNETLKALIPSFLQKASNKEFTEEDLISIGWRILSHGDNYEENIVLQLLEPVPSVDQDSLFQCIYYKRYSENIILKVMEKIRTIPLVHRQENCLQMMTNKVIQAYVKRIENRIPPRELFSLAIQGNCEKSFVLKIIDQIPTSTPDLLSIARNRQCSDIIIQALTKKLPSIYN